jgi:hypothetical protein
MPHRPPADFSGKMAIKTGRCHFVLTAKCLESSHRASRDSRRTPSSCDHSRITPMRRDESSMPWALAVLAVIALVVSLTTRTQGPSAAETNADAIRWSTEVEQRMQKRDVYWQDQIAELQSELEEARRLHREAEKALAERIGQ